MTYTMHVIFTDGYDLSSGINSLAEAVQAIKESFNDDDYMRKLKEIYIISDTTGEIIYQVSINLQFTVSANPYSL